MNEDDVVQSVMDRLYIWRPYNFKVPILREYVYNKSMDYLKKYASESDDIHWIDNVLALILSNSNEWVLDFTEESISIIRNELSNSNYKIITLNVEIENNGISLGNVPVFIYKDYNVVEYYYSDSKLFDTTLGKRLLIEFESVFSSITNQNFEYVCISTEKEPTQIFKRLVRFHKPLLERLILCPQFESFDFLWNFFMLMSLRLARAEINEEYFSKNFVKLSEERQNKVYKLFVNFIAGFSNYLWSNLPEYCRDSMKTIRDYPIGEIKEEYDINQEVNSLIMQCSNEDKKAVKKFLKTNPNAVQLTEFLNTKIDCDIDVSSLVEVINVKNIMLKIRVATLINDALEKINSGDINDIRYLDKIAFPALTVQQNGIFVSPSCIDCIPNRTSFDDYNIKKLALESTAIDSVCLNTLYNQR